MKIRSKFVAVLLLLGMLALPAMAFSSCWADNAGGSQHGCPSACPMMEQQMASMLEKPASSVQAQPASLNCCRISSGKLAPVSQSVVSTGNTRSAAPAEQTTAVSTPFVQAAAQSSDAAPPSPAASPQAVLCTFLI